MRILDKHHSRQWSRLKKAYPNNKTMKKMTKNHLIISLSFITVFIFATFVSLVGFFSDKSNGIFERFFLIILIVGMVVAGYRAIYKTIGNLDLESAILLGEGYGSFVKMKGEIYYIKAPFPMSQEYIRNVTQGVQTTGFLTYRLLQIRHVRKRKFKNKRVYVISFDTDLQLDQEVNRRQTSLTVPIAEDDPLYGEVMKLPQKEEVITEEDIKFQTQCLLVCFVLSSIIFALIYTGLESDFKTTCVFFMGMIAWGLTVPQGNKVILPWVLRVLLAALSIYYFYALASL